MESKGEVSDAVRERLLWVLSAATLLIFFQAYMPFIAVRFGGVLRP